MPGKRCLDSDAGGLHVADFTYHDAVGVLAQESAQCPGKSHSYAFSDRQLQDTLDIVLDRVLGGKQLVLHSVDFPQSGIQSGGFAAASGAGDQEDAVGLFNHVADFLGHGRRHAQVVQAQADHGAVQYAQHDGLAVSGGQG